MVIAGGIVSYCFISVNFIISFHNTISDDVITIIISDVIMIQWSVECPWLSTGQGTMFVEWINPLAINRSRYNVCGVD